MAGTNDVYSKSIGDMVQGVSQQAAEQRRDSQCETQFDCVNSPKDGVIPRPCFEFIFKAASAAYTGAYFYELARGDTEHYLAVFSGGTATIYDLNDGTVCTLTTFETTYLGSDGGAPRDNFDGQTVDDTTFIMTKAVVPAMTSDIQAVRPKEALVFVRAGAYVVTYTISITYNGKVYLWTYKTPDNSVVANADFINTSQIAATFFRSMTGAAAPQTTSGATATTTVFGVQGAYPGDSTSGRLTGAITAASLGFNMQINGNIVRIWRDDGVDFDIDTSDGVGDTFIRALKDKIPAFADLPRNGFDGMIFAVTGANKDSDDDYFVQYQSLVNGDGVWAEVTGPGAHTTLDPATMPHVLTNTGFRTFTWGTTTWSTRIAGDEISAKDPYFVGKTLADIGFFSNRLLILTQGALDFSKTFNEFTFYPDTVQTVLDTDRISIRLTASGNARNQGAALMSKIVQADESLFAWAQRAQFRIYSGQDAFTASTIQQGEGTAYEYTETVDPLSMGQQVYFTSETGEWSIMRAIQFSGGRPSSDSDLTSHVPEYIPSGVRDLSGYDTANQIFIRSDTTGNFLYAYQFLVSGQDVVQSAWNTWRLPAGTILWSSVFRSGLFVALQRADGVLFLRLELNLGAKDPGGQYATRLDLRVREDTSGVSIAVSGGNTTITLPYALPEGTAGNPAVIVRTDKDGGFSRGRSFKVLSVSGSTVTVQGDLTDYEFYVGLLYVAERTESTFFLRGQSGPTQVERLQIRNFKVNHSKSTYYRVEVNVDGSDPKVTPFDGRVLGTSSGVTGTPVLSTGSTLVAVDGENTATTIRLVNDSPFPSAWTSSEYQFQVALRAAISKFGA